MPFKTKKQRREYMRTYRQGKKQILVDGQKLKELRKLFPGAYKLLMSKKKKS